MFSVIELSCEIEHQHQRVRENFLSLFLTVKSFLILASNSADPKKNNGLLEWVCRP